MKWLVTGGAGFIGSNFIGYILKKHPTYEVVNVDALTYAGNLENCSSYEGSSRYRFVKGDITNREFIFNLFEREQFEVVVNFAAESHVDRSISNPDVFLKTNILGTQVLMDACKMFEVRRFHQISTDEVYGDLPLNQPDLFFTEETPLQPSSPYAVSKASADLLVLAYHRTYQLPITISRCSNNYGPYQFPEKLIPLMIQKGLNGEQLPVYGQGVNVRDWLHVKDHCEAIDLIIHNGRVGEVYNIGGHNEKTNLEVVGLIMDLLNIPDSQLSFVADRLGHDLRYAIDPTKIVTELGWNPTYDFERGLKETVAWYVENQGWCERILTGEYRKYFVI